MLSAVDAQFLLDVASRLQEWRLYTYTPGPHRGSYALIVRLADRVQQRFLWEHMGARYASLVASRGHRADTAALDHQLQGAGINGQQTPIACQLLSTFSRDDCDDGLPSSLQMLFLQRRHIRGDRWSCQVQVPGGARDADDASDWQCLVRCVYDQLGIPLVLPSPATSDPRGCGALPDFLYLGQLPDSRSYSRVFGCPGQVQCRYVFLHVGDLTPSLRASHHELESLRWLPLRCFASGSAFAPKKWGSRHREQTPEDTTVRWQRGTVCHPLTGFLWPQSADGRRLITGLFPAAKLCFPCVHIRSGAASPANGTWTVWGQALRSTCELLQLGVSTAPIDWPLITSTSTCMQYAVLYPFHGALGMQSMYYHYRAQVRYGIEHSICAGLPRGWNAVSPACRVYIEGDAYQRRMLALPPSATPFLRAVPDALNMTHVISFAATVVVSIAAMYAVAAAVHHVCSVFRLAAQPREM